MLSIVSMLLVMLLISVSSVWMFRKLPEIQGFIGELFSPSDSAASSKDGLQQFISAASTPGSNASSLRGGKARSVKLRSPKGEVKAPWGW